MVVRDGMVYHAFNPGTSPVLDELYITHRGRLYRLAESRDLLTHEEVSRAFENVVPVGRVYR